MVEFSATLSDALAPVTLISGVGLLLVSMSARYCHATSRIRQLLAERKEESEDFHEEMLAACCGECYTDLQACQPS